MRLFNIGQTIQRKRKESGITQSQLAYQMGVSKSSVSKWETGQTYPDIYLLPELATYFNITVDELLGYQPQLTKEQIGQHYQRLAKSFGTEPFQVVLDECHGLIKKYSACGPFLLQMSILLVNHTNLVEKEQQVAILEEAVELTKKVKNQATEASLIQQATSFEATCQMFLGNPQEVLALLGEELEPYMGNEHLLAEAYALLGQPAKSHQILQASLYQFVLGTLGVSGKLLQHQVDDPHKFDVTVTRIQGVVELYDIVNLHPFVYVTFLVECFMGYLQQGRQDAALGTMERVIAVLGKISYPATLHGDSYFDQLDGWIDDHLELKGTMPRNERVVKDSLFTFFDQTPMIQEGLQGSEKFQALVIKLGKVLSRE